MLEMKYWFTGITPKDVEKHPMKHGANASREEYVYTEYMQTAEKFDIPQHWIAW
jgi:hypothetical protein